MDHSTSWHAYHKVAIIELSNSQTQLISFRQIKNLQTKNQPMLELQSAIYHKNKTHIQFESLLEVKNYTMQVKHSNQMLTLPDPNVSPTVLSAPNLLNPQAFRSRTFTSTPIWMSMNTCGYHNVFSPNISLMRTILNISLLTTESLS